MTRPPGHPALAPFGTTIFAEMSALAVEHGAINLGQGFPDTDGPQAVLDAAKEAIDAGRNQYPPGPGVPELLDVYELDLATGDLNGDGVDDLVVNVSEQFVGFRATGSSVYVLSGGAVPSLLWSWTAASGAFATIARLTGGAHARFDVNAPGSLLDLLRGAAAYAAGGREAMLRLAGSTPAVKGLIAAMDGGKR